MDDKALETLLVQLLPSSRFVSKSKLKHVYGDGGGYDVEVVGYDIALDALHDSEMKLYEALEFLNRPATPDFVAKQIGRLQAVMARRSESNADLAIVVDTYTSHLERYPPDVVAAVCCQIIDRSKWFPLVSDVVAECEKIVRFRKAVWECFQEKRNPMLAAKSEAKRIEADPRLQEAWKTLPKIKWLPQHFDWAIADCEDMLAMALKNPSSMNPALWEEKIVKLKQEKDAA
jgi:hypothetical protein